MGLCTVNTIMLEAPHQHLRIAPTAMVSTRAAVFELKAIAYGIDREVAAALRGAVARPFIAKWRSEVA